MSNTLNETIIENRSFEDFLGIKCNKCDNDNIDNIDVFPSTEVFEHPLSKCKYKYLTFQYFCKECSNVFKPPIVMLDEMIIIENICRKVLLYEIIGNKVI